ncbi:MAG: hypothetical protein ACI9EF_001359 [Pseudohongiellaceae bacterium]|jgi:hypothetical protein
MKMIVLFSIFCVILGFKAERLDRWTIIAVAIFTMLNPILAYLGFE